MNGVLADYMPLNSVAWVTFLFAEKRIQRFDESRFQGREMKWSASSSEDREFVLIVM